MLACFLVLAASFSFFYAGAAGGETYVGPSETYTTIQDAVDNAAADDTIIVRDGTYTENVVVDKSLTIRSENGSAATIVQALDLDEHVFTVSADNVTISGFTVTGATGYLRAGIVLSGSDQCTISGNDVTDNYFGIRLVDSSDYNELQDNICTGNDYIGIDLWYGSNNNLLSDNTCNENTFEASLGIRLAGSHNNTLVNNTCNLNNYLGIELYASDSNTLRDNNASSNLDRGIRLVYSNDNNLTNNTATANANAGIQLDEYSSRNVLARNTVAENAHGILLTTASTNEIKGNLLVNNTGETGVHLDENSTDNVIHSNCFINNDPQAVDSGTDNRWSGNYWSDLAPPGRYAISGTAESEDCQPLPCCLAESTTECESGVKGFENKYNLTITVYRCNTSQTIRITDGSRTVEIQVLGHNFSCAEVVDLLIGLELANFATLPEVILVDYTSSVNLSIWRSRLDCEPDLTVQNLELITGNGNFSRPLRSCNCSSGDDDDNCTDERIIVGVTELAKLVQSYGTLPLWYEQLVVDQEHCTSVYYNGGEPLATRLTVAFGELLEPPTGIFAENVAAVDVVTAFGSPWVWEEQLPYNVIQLGNESGNLSIEYGAAGNLTVTYESSLIFDSLPVPMFKATLEASAGKYWWSEPAFSKVHFGNDSGNLSVVFGDANLTMQYDESLIFNSLPSSMFRSTLEASGGHFWWSEPSFSTVHFANDSGNLSVIFGDANLTVTYDGSLIFRSLSDGKFRAALEASGGHVWWSEPSFSEVNFINDTVNDSLVVTYGSDGAVNLTTSYENALLESLEDAMFRALLDASGSHAWWSQPAFNEVQYLNESNCLIIDFGNRASEFVSLLRIFDCLLLCNENHPELLRAILEWFGDNERFAEIIQVIDEVRLVCAVNGQAGVTMLNDGVPRGSGLIDPDAPLVADAVPDFLTRLFSASPEQVPTLNFSGLIILFALLSLVALRRIRPRV